MEFFREPDSTIYFGWLTKGQLYSALMIIGAGLILWKKCKGDMLDAPAGIEP
jgi:prolipoprotein diacylglyceryltransferase